MARQLSVTLKPLHLPTVQPGESLSDVTSNCLKEEKIRLERADILAVASKIVSTCEGRIVKLADVPITRLAKNLSRRWRVEDRLAAIVVGEADQILGGVTGFLLTTKNGILTPNAGVDVKNSPPGTATLWPLNPDRSARLLRRNLERRFRTRIGVEVVDSRVTPLRLGTAGLAIGVSGFAPVLDRRGVRDIFGRPIRVTQANVADDVAAAAHFLMGESTEHIGAVLIRGTGIAMDSDADGGAAKLSGRRCLIGNNLAKIPGDGPSKHLPRVGSF